MPSNENTTGYLETAANAQNALEGLRQSSTSFKAELQRTAGEAMQTAATIREAFSNTRSDIGKGFSALLNGDTKQFLSNFRSMISKESAQIQKNLWDNAVKTIAGAGTSASGNNGAAGQGIATFVSSMLAGARAGGGNVGAGGAYLVGENGPEIFVPHSSGNIIPNGQVGQAGQGGGVNITMHITTPNADSFRKSQSQIMAEAARVISRSQRNL